MYQRVGRRGPKSGRQLALHARRSKLGRELRGARRDRWRTLRPRGLAVGAGGRAFQAACRSRRESRTARAATRVFARVSAISFSPSASPWPWRCHRGSASPCRWWCGSRSASACRSAALRAWRSAWSTASDIVAVDRADRASHRPGNAARVLSANQGATGPSMLMPLSSHKARSACRAGAHRRANRLRG